MLKTICAGCKHADCIKYDGILCELSGYIEYKDQCDHAEPVMNCWIPCSERLPEIDEDVIIYYSYWRDNPIHIAHRQEGYFWETSDGEFNPMSYGITHWMPLPEPPRGGDDNG